MYTEIWEIRNKAKACRKQDNYNGVIEVYKDSWEKQKLNFDKWDYWRYSYSLRKVGKIKDALELCTETYEKSPEFVQNISVYSWCLFDYYINKDNDEINKSEHEFLNTAKTITNLTNQNQYSPYERTVFKVIKYFKSKPSFSATIIGEWLNKLEPKLLSNDIYMSIDKKGIEREQASSKEIWYSIKTKVLIKQLNYKECIDVGNVALVEIKKFHYGDDIWIKKRIACSKGKLGNKKEAISELKKLLLYKEHWTIQYDISKLYDEIGGLEEALNFAYDAVLNGNDFKIKLPLIFDLAIMLKNKNKIEMAKKHILLCKKIRIENNWSIPSELLDQVNSFKLNESNESSESIYKELRKYWEKEKNSRTPSITGEIQSVFSDGNAGFILGNNNKKYYFKIKDFNGNSDIVKISLKVKFRAKKGFDSKKGEESDQAVFIRKVDTK